jgi:cell division protein FtsQ
VTVPRTRLVSPRTPAAGISDLGERTPFIAGQRVGRAQRRRRARRAARAARALGVLMVGGLVLAGSAVAIRWLLTAPRFAVTAVDVSGTSRVSADRVRAAAAIEPGTNVWRLDPAAITARVESVPEIRRAEVIRNLPNRISILVEERRPFTLVHAGRLHWLDEEGRVLDEAREATAPAVPVVSGLSDAELFTMRTDPSPRARDAVALIRVLLRTRSALVSEISEIDVSRNDGPVLYTVDGVEVRLGTDEWEERLARLERILGQVGREGETVHAIDLRFRDQVVLTKGGSG